MILDLTIVTNTINHDTLVVSIKQTKQNGGVRSGKLRKDVN